MYCDKPIIGLVGGIGAGKSFVARLMTEMGCAVIDSDALVHEIYRDPEVKAELRKWWGESVFDMAGEVARSAVGRRVFADASERERLERLIHPRVHALRDQLMQQAAKTADVLAFVWDAPLLLETGLGRECDATVFVDAPLSVRQARVAATRGWDAAELARREFSQMPLDKKREMSDYLVVNATDADSTRVQVRNLLSRIIAGATRPPVEGSATSAKRVDGDAS
jgi:dephospho-CoA kinase